MVLLICSVCVVLYFAGSGVKSVVMVLDALRVSWFCLVQSYISCRYGCTCCCDMCGFVCVDRMVVLSANVTVVMFGDVGVGRSAVYVLKSFGESTPSSALWDSCFCVPECGFVVVVKCILFASLM